MLGVTPLQILVYITSHLAIAAITTYNNANLPLLAVVIWLLLLLILRTL